MRNFKAKVQGAKNFILGMVTMALIFAFVTSVSALVATKTATVTYNDIKVNIDGEMVTLTDVLGGTVEPILVFDTLYAPVSPLARAFGYTATYDGNAKTVFIRERKAGDPTTTVKLSDLTPKSTENAKFGRADKARDNEDNYHQDVMRMGFGWWGEKRGFADYALNSQYSRIEGTIFLEYDYRDTGSELFLKIWTDGKLVYTSPRLTKGVSPIPFNVDLNNVKEIRIGIDGSIAYYDNVAICISNTTLHKYK